MGIGENCLDTERLGDHVVITIVSWRGAAVVVDDLGAIGAAEAGHPAETLGNGVAARVEGVGVLHGGYSGGSVEDAGPCASGELMEYVSNVEFIPNSAWIFFFRSEPVPLFHWMLIFPFFQFNSFFFQIVSWCLRALELRFRLANKVMKHRRGIALIARIG